MCREYRHAGIIFICIGNGGMAHECHTTINVATTNHHHFVTGPITRKRAASAMAAEPTSSSTTWQPPAAPSSSGSSSQSQPPSGGHQHGPIPDGWTNNLKPPSHTFNGGEHDGTHPTLNLPADCSTPEELFDFILLPFLEKEASPTSKTNVHRAKTGRQPLGVDILKRFIFANIVMGLVQLPSEADYWCTQGENARIFGVSYMRDLISRDDFRGVKESLKFDINDAQSHFNSLWTDIINVGDAVSVDECLWQFTGPCKHKCYCPKKPHPEGLKFFLMCCSHTSLLLHSILYQGDTTPEGIPTKMSSTADSKKSVWTYMLDQLLDFKPSTPATAPPATATNTSSPTSSSTAAAPCCLFNMPTPTPTTATATATATTPNARQFLQTVVFADQGFGSLEGAIESDNRYIPFLLCTKSDRPSAIFTHCLHHNLQPGEVRAIQGTLDSDHPQHQTHYDIMAVAYNDNTRNTCKTVNFLTNCFHPSHVQPPTHDTQPTQTPSPPTTTTTPDVVDDDAGTGWEGTTCKKCEMVRVYIALMGGVDRFDRLLYCYHHGRRQKDWKKCCRWGIIKMVITQLHIMHGIIHGQKIPHKDFLLQLLFSIVPPNVPSTLPPSILKKSGHFPDKFLAVTGCTKRKCAYKHCPSRKPTPTVCVKCRVNLHSSFCFRAYHHATARSLPVEVGIQVFKHHHSKHSKHTPHHH